METKFRISVRLKKTTFIYLASLFILSCSKNNEVVPTVTPGPKLKKILNNDRGEWVFNYNEQGRLIGHLYHQDGSQPLSTISYTGNEAVMIMGNSSDNSVDDTEIKFTLDGDSKPVKSIQRTFIEFKGALTPQRYFYNDTIYYEYDALGLLKKTSEVRFDSLWQNPGNLEIHASRSRVTTDYTTNAGNLISSMRVRISNGLDMTSGTTNYYENRREEETWVYEYSKQYPNKTDFTNAYALNWLKHAPFLLNKNYKNMPDKIAHHLIIKDKEGKIIEKSDIGGRTMTLEFDANGYLSDIRSNLDFGSFTSHYKLIYE